MIIDGGLIDAGFGYDIPHAGAGETLFCEKMDGGLMMASRVCSAGRVIAFLFKRPFELKS